MADTLDELLQSVEEAAKELGQKETGDLILAESWHDLVGAVDKLRQAIVKCKEDVAADFSAADKEINDALTEDLQGLENQIEALKGQFYRVTLESDSSSYALGEVAQITAHITDVDGNALPAGTRPWLHFIANWGTLKAAGGFDSRSGVGNRTLAVRANASGVAQVRLSAEQVQELEAEQEGELAGLLQTAVTFQGGTKTYKQVIMESTSPLDAKEKGAFQVANKAYDQVVPFREAADSMFERYPDLVRGGPVVHDWGHWTDYGAMMTAFVGLDSDPKTPDWSHGASALLVTFREWVGPWAGLGYLEVEDSQVGQLKNVIEGRVTKDHAQSIIQIQDAVTSAAAGKGVLGAQKAYRTVHRALDVINPPDPPPFLNDLRVQMKDMVAFQQTVGTAVGPDVVIKALAGAAASSGSQVGDVKNQVRNFEDTVQALQTELAGAKKDLADARDQLRRDMDAKIQAWDGRVADAQASFGVQVAAAKQELGAEVQAIGTKVEQVRSQVETVVSQQVVDLVKQVGVLQGQYDKALGEGGDVQNLKADVVTLRDKYGVFEQQGVAPSTIANRFLDIQKQQIELQELKETVKTLQHG